MTKKKLLGHISEEIWSKCRIIENTPSDDFHPICDKNEIIKEAPGK